MNNLTKTKLTVLVTVEVEHETTASIEFINDIALDAVSKSNVIGVHHNEGMYKATALTKEIIDLDVLRKINIKKYISASLKASDSYC